MVDGLRTQVTTTPTQIILKLSGTITENVHFPNLDQGLPLHIDFGEITRINSRGITLWSLWISQYKGRQIYLERCPSVIIKTFNLVKGSLPPGVQVDSFFVPLFSPQTGERRDVLLTRGKEYSGTSVNVPDQKDSSGNPMEVDVHESYWAFLG